MSMKETVFKIMVKLLTFLKKDLDISRQRLIFTTTMRKSIKEMDRDQLGQLIRFNAHALDKATKCENRDVGRGRERKQLLERALDEWQERGYPLGPDKIWAREILKSYGRWCMGEAKLIQPVKEDHKYGENDIFSVIEQRRSVRFWKKKRVEREKIEKILRAATYAPSSCNRMTWRFFVVENDLDNIFEGDSTNRNLLEKAPVRVYLGIDERLYPEIYAPAIDAGCALQNLILAAHALGLGSCLMYHCESVNQEKLRTELGIPAYYRIYCAVPLGYPDEIPSTPGRVSLDEVSTFVKGNGGIDCFAK